MFRIRWLDPSSARRYWCGLQFDENGVSRRAWSTKNHPRIRAYFWTNANRKTCEIVEERTFVVDVGEVETASAVQELPQFEEGIADSGAAVEAAIDVEAPAPAPEPDPIEDANAGQGDVERGEGGEAPAWKNAKAPRRRKPRA